MGFLVALAWIYTIASEIVNILEVSAVNCHVLLQEKLSRLASMKNVVAYV